VFLYLGSEGLFCYRFRMTRSPGYCGVILAAGTPDRLSNALSPWPSGNPLGSSLLSSHVDVLNTVSELVLVVVGTNEPLITPTVYAHGGYLVSAAQSACSDFQALQLGVREVLSRGRDTAIITPVDITPLTPNRYRALCTAYQESGRDVWAVVSGKNEGGRFPTIAGREFIEQVLRASAESSLVEIMSANAEHVLSLDVANETQCANSEQVAGK
jgi:CTP:molybdopterin cytidylyltransferase MocA